MATSDFSEFTNDFGDWLCTICREGDGANGLRTQHECGKHEFHTTCLTDWRKWSHRCPICRFPLEAEVPVYSQTLEPQTQSSEESEESLIDETYLATLHLLPLPVRQSRINLGIGISQDRLKNCVWCENIINGLGHPYIRHCGCDMHYACLIMNIICNGINNDSVRIHCPVCDTPPTH